MVLESAPVEIRRTRPFRLRCERWRPRRCDWPDSDIESEFGYHECLRLVNVAQLAVDGAVYGFRRSFRCCCVEGVVY